MYPAVGGRPTRSKRATAPEAATAAVRLRGTLCWSWSGACYNSSDLSWLQSLKGRTKVAPMILGPLWGAERCRPGTSAERIGIVSGTGYPKTWIGQAHTVPGKWLVPCFGAE